CTNKKCVDYPNYGGRGIMVCDRWHTFDNFLADMGEKPAAKSIDRIDNNKGYSPENCRWATLIEQANNKRSNVRLTFNGRTQSIKQWAMETGIPYKTLYYRIRYSSWPVEEALSTPVA